MRFPITLTAVLVLLAACSKNNDDETPARSGPNVNAASLSQQFSAGSSLIYARYTTNVAALVPATGAGQTWNFSSLTGGVNDTMRLVTAGNNAFPSAAYAREEVVNFGVGTNTQPINIRTYFEVSANGWFELGRSLPAVTFTIPGTATIAFNAQSNAYTPNRLPLTPALPAYEGDSVSFTSALQESGTVTTNSLPFPAAVSMKNTYTGGVKVVGSGSLQYPGAGAPVNAVLIRRSFTRTSNFLLNGTTPDASLLNLLGITDGQQAAVDVYDFYGQGNEGYLGTLYRENGTTLYAYFRKN